MVGVMLIMRATNGAYMGLSRLLLSSTSYLVLVVYKDTTVLVVVVLTVLSVMNFTMLQTA